jgi:hypothetical protein
MSEDEALLDSGFGAHKSYVFGQARIRSWNVGEKETSDSGSMVVRVIFAARLEVADDGG